MRKHAKIIRQLETRWGRGLDKEHVLGEYPRPLMRRDDYVCLNGMWDYAFTKSGRRPDCFGKAGEVVGVCENSGESGAGEGSCVFGPGGDVLAAGRIRVPFSPEALLSEVNRQLQPDEFLWYRRMLEIDAEKMETGMRLLLHFGAVDQHCRVYVGGREVARHTGGYLPFTVDVTEPVMKAWTEGTAVDVAGDAKAASKSVGDAKAASKDAGDAKVASKDAGDAKAVADDAKAAMGDAKRMWQVELSVVVKDVSDTSYHARGKQKLERGGMYYTAQSGIWQTVWMEYVPRQYIEDLEVRTELVEAGENGEPASGKVRVTVKAAEDLPTEVAVEQAGIYSGDVAGENAADGGADGNAADGGVDGNAADGGADENAADGGVDGNAADGGVDGNAADGVADGNAADGGVDGNAKKDGAGEAAHPRIVATAFGKANQPIEINVPEVRLWNCETPYLYFFTVKMGADVVRSYFAVRTFTVEPDEKGIPRICLNHEPQFQKGVLDQGYWPDGLYTAPADEALVYDIRTMKSVGFNMIRKHIKIEPQRWYYHCDRLGMVVWQDMVNGGSSYQDWYVTYLATALSCKNIKVEDRYRWLLSRRDKKGRLEFVREMRETIRLLKRHPSIAAWVVFNEGWGQFSTREMTEIVRREDDTRLIDSASGWFDQGCGDMQSVHNYFFKLEVKPEKERAAVLSEFGGIALQVQGHSACEELYGYGTYTDLGALNQAYKELDAKVQALIPEGLCASVYTQVSDVEEEVNGVLTFDREVQKIY